MTVEELHQEYRHETGSEIISENEKDYYIEWLQNKFIKAYGSGYKKGYSSGYKKGCKDANELSIYDAQKYQY